MKCLFLYINLHQCSFKSQRAIVPIKDFERICKNYKLYIQFQRKSSTLSCNPHKYIILTKKMQKKPRWEFEKPKHELPDLKE